LILQEKIKKRTKTLNYKAKRYGFKINDIITEVTKKTKQNYYRKLAKGETDELEIIEKYLDEKIKKKLNEAKSKGG
jgi:hypothetical protein